MLLRTVLNNKHDRQCQKSIFSKGELKVFQINLFKLISAVSTTKSGCYFLTTYHKRACRVTIFSQFLKTNYEII